MQTIKILFFGASPRGTAPLDLTGEFREIDEEVSRGAYREALTLILVPGTRPVDLFRKLNENQPQVIHFSSHGNADEIIIEAEVARTCDPLGMITRSTGDRDMELAGLVAAEGAGQAQHPAHAVSKSALVSVLRSCDNGNIRLIVLNACHTRSLAAASPSFSTASSA